MTDESKCGNCYLYVLDTLADWEIGFITAELTSKRYFAKNRTLNFLKIGNTLEPITTMGGMVIVPDKDIMDIEFQEGDLLILPGADTWMDERNKKILEIVSKIIDQNVAIAAICGATFALTQWGLLDNRTHTSNDKDLLKMICPGYTGSDHYINKPAVTDGNLITASGLAPLEFSCEVFKKIGVMKDDTIEAWFQLYTIRDSKSFYNLMESLK